VSEAIKTDRLILRPLQQEDADRLHRAFSDPDVMRWFADVHTDLQQTRDWVMGTLREPVDKTREYAILRDGQVIGKAGIWNRPELGYLLTADHWRQGLAFEALSALLPHLFTLMELDHITADVDPRNAPSLGLLHKLGFVETHSAKDTIKIAGEWGDSIYLRLSAPV